LSLKIEEKSEFNTFFEHLRLFCIYYKTRKKIITLPLVQVF